MRVITSTAQRARRGGDHWPRPPSALQAARLTEPPEGARVCVAGLVILRQRPGTAKGVIFLTLEDETGIVNVIVWRKLYERFRRAVIAGRMLRVTGRVQREAGVIHVVAEEIEDISAMLDALVDPEAALSPVPEGGTAAQYDQDKWYAGRHQRGSLRR